MNRQEINRLNEIDRIKTEHDTKIDILVNNYNLGKINFASYNSEKERLDKKYRDDVTKINNGPSHHVQNSYVYIFGKRVKNI